MTTKQTGRGEGREQASPLYEQDTVKDVNAPSAYPSPQPPRGPQSAKKRWYISLSLAIVFLLILSGGILWAMQLRQQPSVQPTPTPAATATAAVSSPSRNETTPIAPVPGVVLGPQACTPVAKDLTRWASIIGIGS
ncbi:MAG TPA: hypothetical protein VH593_07275, partial [Ktedonobacteraceae bacterium]